MRMHCYRCRGPVLRESSGEAFCLHCGEHYTPNSDPIIDRLVDALELMQRRDEARDRARRLNPGRGRWDGR